MAERHNQGSDGLLLSQVCARPPSLLSSGPASPSEDGGGPGSSRLLHLGQGTAASSCLVLGHPLDVSVGSWGGFAPYLCFGAVAAPLGAGSSVLLAHRAGWVAWHSMAHSLVGEAGQPSWSPGLGSLGSHSFLSPMPVQCPCVPLGQREGSLAQGHGSHQSTLDELSLSTAGKNLEPEPSCACPS